MPAALYGAEMWGVTGAEGGKVLVLEMRCLGSLVGVLQMDGVRNEEVHRRARVVGELASGVDRRVLGWFGHVEGVDGCHVAGRVLMAEVSGGG